MKKKSLLKLFIFLLAFAMLAFVLGCGSTEEPVDTESGDDTEKSEAGDPDLEAENEADEKEVLLMGTNAGFIPFEFLNEDEEIDGFDIELAEEIASILGMELEVLDMDFGGLILAVKNGQIDIAVAGITITEERLESVNFSDPYYVAGQTIVVREDETGISGIEDLAGRLVGVQEGTTGDFECDDLIEEGLFKSEDVRRFPQVNEVFLALESGQVDAVIMDEPVANRYIEERGGMKTIGGVFTEEEFGIAIAKENKELLEQINAALKEIK
ncbi:MAG: basic amino acid ABC transporter substrate-binding protein, partial [Firmicutes bacterium]|nr:basic amino acid ABC transporter substrate-binding protein [Bacillota bacterium]